MRMISDDDYNDNDDNDDDDSDDDRRVKGYGMVKTRAMMIVKIEDG